MGHTAKEWLGATRFWSFPVSAMPVIATACLLAWKDYDICWTCALLALAGNVLFHAAGNVLSDWWDYRMGVDNEQAYAVPNLVFHMFEPAEYVRLSALLFTAAAAVGIILTFMSGWLLLVIGVTGALLAASYSFFKFRALGDIFVFVCFGVLPVIGTSYVCVGQIVWSALVLSLPLGILTVAVLHDNNTVDIETDRACGIRTMAMMLGEKRSVRLYIAYMYIPYILAAAACATGLLPAWALLCLLSFPAAYGNISKARSYSVKGREAMIGLDEKTAQLHLLFSVLLSAGLTAAAFIQ